MALTPEQVRALKEQLLSQIQNLSPAQKAEAETQINALSPEALELMLKQQQHGKKQEANEGIFRLIIKGDIPSSKIDENASAVAVLEINPVSKGHLIIIPKKAITKASEMPSSAFALAKKLSEKLISKLEAKSTEIQTETKLGEIIINVIPIYNQPLNLNSPRKKASKEELEELENKLKVKKKPKIEKIKKERKPGSSQILKLPRKIP
ncbi:MAG TPA: HIT domain-containing protein [Candidatus Nanoarchaeia archaeon]|nr:HIT domain-containing protein [Candidatus Nanoarchaeia archaeon]